MSQRCPKKTDETGSRSLEPSQRAQLGSHPDCSLIRHSVPPPASRCGSHQSDLLQKLLEAHSPWGPTQLGTLNPAEPRIQVPPLGPGITASSDLADPQTLDVTLAVSPGSRVSPGYCHKLQIWPPHPSPEDNRGPSLLQVH